MFSPSSNREGNKMDVKKQKKNEMIVVLVLFFPSSTNSPFNQGY